MGSISMDKDISIAVHVLNIHFSDFGDTAVGYQVVVQHNGSLTLADSDSVLVARTGQLVSARGITSKLDSETS